MPRRYVSLTAGRICRLSLLVAALGAPMSAQTSDSLHPGLRVRVIQAVPPRQLVGSVQAAGDISITIVPDGRSAAQDIPLSTIHSLEAAAGKRRPLARGALWGALAGLAFGTTLALADGHCLYCVDSDGGGPLLIGFTTVIGTVFGLAAGSVSEQYRWQAIRIPRH